MTLSTRPPSVSDATTLLDWRNSAAVRSMSLNDDEIGWKQHTAWLDTVIHGPAGRFLVVCWDANPVGVCHIEKLDVEQGTAGWACHMGGQAPPGFGACLPVLGLALGFGRFEARRMAAQVLGTNRNMLAVHRKLGVPNEGVAREHIRRDDGTTVDLVNFGVLRNEWPAILSRAMSLVPSYLRESLNSEISSFNPARPT